MSDPCVYFASSCMRFVTANRRHVHIWSLETLVCECTFTEPKGEVAIVTLSSDGRCLASYWHGYSSCEADTVRVWIVEKGLEVTFVHGLGRVTDMCFSPDGNRLATISCLNIASVWNRATGVCEFRFSPNSLVRVAVGEYSWERTIRARNSVSFSLDGNRVATTCPSSGVLIWRLESGLCELRLSGHSGFIRMVRFSCDGSRIATASDDGTAKIWCARSGACELTINVQCGVVCVGFSSDGRRLVTVGEDNLVCVWDTSAGAMLFGTDEHLQRVALAVFHQG